ncbi:hypothetical protein M1446_02950 [Candidatus Dependentiae bacterium]|nr:hypothetical protein [Candidatus Dependentiae bacterium]
MKFKFLFFFLAFNLNAMLWKNPKSLQWLSAIEVAKQTKLEDIYPENYPLKEISSLIWRTHNTMVKNAVKNQQEKNIMTSSLSKSTNISPIMRQALIFCNSNILPKLKVLPEVYTGLQNHLAKANKICANNNIIFFFTTNGYVKTFYVANIETEKCHEIISLTNEIRCIAINNKKKFLIFDDGAGRIYCKQLLCIGLPELLFTLEKHKVTSLALSVQGNLLAIGCSNGDVVIKSLTNNIEYNYCEKLHDGPVYCLDFDESENLLVTGGADAKFNIIDLYTGQLIYDCQDDQPVLTVKFDPSGKFIFYGNKKIKIKDWSDNLNLIQLHHTTYQPFEIFFDKKNSKIVAIFKDGTIMQWKDPKDYRYLNLTIEQFFFLKIALSIDLEKKYHPTNLNSGAIEWHDDQENFKPTNKKMSPLERAQKKIGKFTKHRDFLQFESTVQDFIKERLIEKLNSFQAQQTNIDHPIVEKNC